MTPLAGLLILVVLNLGCEPSNSGIVEHKVHKSRSGLDALRKEKTATLPAQATAPAAKVKNRMAVAIFDKPDATWFFKLNGPLDQVNAAEEQWLTFFDSVSFEDGKPKWDAPEEWSTAGPKPMRFATFLIKDSEGSKPIELAVSSLGPNQDMLLNVNRWRGQLGLDDFSKDELDTQLKSKKSEHGEFLLFDAEGMGSGTMRPPFAGGGKAPFAPFAGGGGQTSKAPSSAADSGLDFTAPKGWTKGKTSSMVPIRLQKEDGEAKVQITVIEMPADANEWEPNVKRWAGQVGLSFLTDEEVAKHTSEITVDEIPGKLVDLVAESKSDDGVIAGMVKRDGSAWFFKLFGEKELVDQSREEFEAFMESVKYQ